MRTVLVVDDSAADRLLAGGLLEKHSIWNIIYATDGASALREIERHIPDVVLTDLQMPEMDGLELVAQVKRNFPLIPVVITTSKGSEEIAVQALQQGASSYVSKKRLSSDLHTTLLRVIDSAADNRNQIRLLHRVASSKTCYVLHNDLDLIFTLVRHLQQTIRCVQLADETERLRVGIALEEALLNAFYHGNLEIDPELRATDIEAHSRLVDRRCQEDPYCGRRIFIDVYLTRTEAKYIVRDEGPGFDVSSIRDPKELSHLEHPTGRGVLLMRSFMDELKFNELGNEVTMIKRSVSQEELEDLDVTQAE